jgi:hypothetical protein
MVGRAVGERLLGDRDRRMDAVEDPSAHVGMEVGLDLALLERVPDVSRPPAAPFFRGGDVRLLAAALERTYGLPWSPHHLLLNHRRAR